MHSVSNGAVGEAMVQIARSKIALDPVSALARGVPCNVPGCLARLVVDGSGEYDR